MKTLIKNKNITLVLALCLIVFLSSCTTNKYYVSDSFGYTNQPQVAKKTVKTTTTVTTTQTPVEGNYVNEEYAEYQEQDDFLGGNIFESTTTKTETIINDYYYVADPYYYNYPSYYVRVG